MPLNISRSDLRLLDLVSRFVSVCVVPGKEIVPVPIANPRRHGEYACRGNFLQANSKYFVRLYFPTRIARRTPKKGNYDKTDSPNKVSLQCLPICGTQPRQDLHTGFSGRDREGGCATNCGKL